MALVLVPRLVATLMGSDERLPLGPQVWAETALILPPELAAGRWANVFTGETFDTPADRALPVAQVLGPFPVALCDGRQ